MNIQIIGTKKCQETRKAERYFKERRINYQFIDLTVRGLSKGELNSVKSAIGLSNLIDTAGKLYRQKNLNYMVHDIEEVLLAYPLLLKIPVVRNGRLATLGYQPDVWQNWQTAKTNA